MDSIVSKIYPVLVLHINPMKTGFFNAFLMLSRTRLEGVEVFSITKTAVVAFSLTLMLPRQPSFRRPPPLFVCAKFALLSYIKNACF